MVELAVSRGLVMDEAMQGDLDEEGMMLEQ